MKEMCHNCGNEVISSFGEFYCPRCGAKLDYIDYAQQFEDKDVDSVDEFDNYGNLRKGFNLRDKDISPFFKELFSIIKTASVSVDKGFASLDYGKLCQEVDKWNSVPDPSKITIISNPGDSKPQNPFELIGLFGISKYEGKKTIVLNPKKIIDEKGKGVAALILLHELMHAAMYVGKSEPVGEYWYYKEESYANAFALKLLQASSHDDWFQEALQFVKEQPKGYDTGAALLCEPISMQSFIEEKKEPEKVSEDVRNTWTKAWIDNPR